MTDADLERRVREALEPTAEDLVRSPAIVDAAMHRVSTTRHPGRRRILLPAAAALAALALAGGVYGATRLASNGTSSDPATAAASVAQAPSVLEITCEKDRIVVGSATVAASPDGVHLRVTNRSADPEMYLGYRPAGPSTGEQAAGGDRVDELREARVEWAPGAYDLSCQRSGGDRSQAPARVVITDPGEHYRPGGLEKIGCWAGGPRAEVSWAIGPSRETTAQAAVDALIDRMHPTTPRLAGEPAPIGYVDSPVQTWLLRKSGAPWVTVRVEALSGAYQAGLDTPCDPYVASLSGQREATSPATPAR